jgi:hypothetical protein
MSFSIRSFVILWWSVPMVNGKLVFSIQTVLLLKIPELFVRP